MYFIFLLTYLLYLLIRTSLIIVGFIVVPLMATFHTHTTVYTTSIINGRPILSWKHKFMYIFDNFEDGLIGASEFKDKSIFVRIVYWNFRNPVNNLRTLPYFSVKINPKKINYVLSSAKDFNGNVIINPTLRDYDRDDLRYTTLIWQDGYSNFRIQFKMFNKIWRFWIGYKIHVHDIYGIPENSYRYNGAGFATQFKKIYPRINK